jgi:hypothetical protein
MPAQGMDIRGLGPNAGNGILYADGVSIGSGGVNAPKPIVSTSVTFTPASLTALATPATAFADSSAITVNGAQLNDIVTLFPPYDTQGVIATGRVTAANTIKIGLLNPTAATVALASGTWGIVVSRR